MEVAVRSMSLSFISLLSIAACGGTATTTPQDSDTSVESDTPVTDGTWFATCGDPVCKAYSGPFDGVPVCTDEVLGETCVDLGERCDPMDACNALWLCAMEDPTQQPGGCPISRRAHKRDIAYLDADGIAAARREVGSLRLATWRYRWDDAARRPHLGFLIDDAPTSVAVQADGEHVDLYGYTSLAVAAIQAQEAELVALRTELAALRADVAALRSAASTGHGEEQQR